MNVLDTNLATNSPPPIIEPQQLEQSNDNVPTIDTGLASTSLIPFVEPCGVVENLQHTIAETVFLQHPPQVANPFFFNNPRHNNALPEKIQGEKITDH